jgi:hypothetical protein
MKICSKCKLEKDESLFHRNKQSKDGLCSKCKDCSKEYGKLYREKNKEILCEKSLPRRRLKAKENNMRAKLWYEKNKDKKCKYDKEYTKRTIEKRKMKNKDYYIKNREKIIERNSKYIINRYNTDEKVNTIMRLRHRLREAFRRFSKNRKVGSSRDYEIDWQKIIDYLGPCPGDRRDYHIDHIIPLCSFDFDNKEEIKKAFAPENHQWLRKEDNLSKNRKIIYKTKEE